METVIRHPYSVVDVHVHVSPQYADQLAAIMEANNLSAVVNLGVIEWLGLPFDEAMAAFRKALGDRMAYFMLAHFHDTSPGFGERMAEELERKVEAGACGLKVLKELGLRYRDADGKLIPVDDPRLDVLWAKAGELGVPVLIHTADPVAFFQPLDEHNERRMELELHPDWHFFGPEFPSFHELLEQRNRVLERHPDTIFIGAHVGGYPESLVTVGEWLDRYPNFYVDTAARIGEIGRRPPAEVREFFIKYQDRILFGSDLVLGWRYGGEEPEAPVDEMLAEANAFYDLHWPYYETNQCEMEYPGYPIQGEWKVSGIQLPEAVLRKLYESNARRLIPALRR